MQLREDGKEEMFQVRTGTWHLFRWRHKPQPDGSVDWLSECGRWDYLEESAKQKAVRYDDPKACGACQFVVTKRKEHNA